MWDAVFKAGDAVPARRPLRYVGILGGFLGGWIFGLLGIGAGFRLPNVKEGGRYEDTARFRMCC